MNNNNSKTAVIDIDNTLWDFGTVWHKELKKHYPKIANPCKWKTWASPDKKTNLDKDIIRITAEAVHISQEDYGCFVHAPEFLEQLKSSGFLVQIVTSRSDSTKEQTVAWLSKHKLVYDELHLLFNKEHIISKSSLLFDDAPHYLEYAVGLNIPAMSLMYPYNDHVRGVDFVHDLEDATEYIAREII